MKCPKCGSPRFKYVVSRKDRWGTKKKVHSKVTRESVGGSEPRTNHTAKCPKCGYEEKGGDN